MCENYRKIRNFCQFHGKPFTVKQAANYTGMKKVTAINHIKRLIDRDYIMIVGKDRGAYVYDRTGRPEQVPAPIIQNFAQRKINIIKLVQAIGSTRCYTIADICRASGFGFNTVKRYLFALMQLNAVFHNALIKPRKTPVYTLSTPKKVAAAIDYVAEFVVTLSPQFSTYLRRKP